MEWMGGREGGNIEHFRCARRMKRRRASARIDGHKLYFLWREGGREGGNIEYFHSVSQPFGLQVPVRSKYLNSSTASIFFFEFLS
jgi:hypothetical protein